MGVISLRPVDYPKLGVEDPSWRRFSPAEPKAWHAYWLELGDGQGVFLGEGDTDLSFESRHFGETIVVCVRGYPYVINSDGAVRTVPCYLLGYSQFVDTEEMMVFCNYAELAIVHRSGEVRYSCDLAVDDLWVVSVSGQTVNLTGLKELGSEPEDFFINVSQIPEVQKVW